MLDYPALAALAAVVRCGSFDDAAARLGVTPSAVSQRIRNLEERIGTVLVIRTHPVTATDAGRRLVRHFEDVALLEAELAADLDEAVPTNPATVRIALNADSLATWFLAALADVKGLSFELVVDDQDHAAEWLARGDVMAAVAASARPVRGCSAEALGVLRYVATASPGFRARWFGDGVTAEALARAPALRFNEKDALQHVWAMREVGRRVALSTHRIPSSHGFVEAARRGLGWGMNPELLVRDDIASGRLVAIGQTPTLDVPLYWHTSNRVAKGLIALTRAVRNAAGAALAATPEASSPTRP